jgi:hypothetical protein
VIRLQPLARSGLKPTHYRERKLLLGTMRPRPTRRQMTDAPKIRINDQIVCLLPRRYRVDRAFLPKCVRAPRGDGRGAWMNCGLSADLIGCRLPGLGEI